MGRVEERVNAILRVVQVDDSEIAQIEGMLKQEKHKWEDEADKWTMKQRMKEMEHLVTIEEKIDALKAAPQVRDLHNLITYDSEEITEAIYSLIKLQGAQEKHTHLLSQNGILNLSSGKISPIAFKINLHASSFQVDDRLYLCGG